MTTGTVGCHAGVAGLPEAGRHADRQLERLVHAGGVTVGVTFDVPSCGLVSSHMLPEVGLWKLRTTSPNDVVTLPAWNFCWRSVICPTSSALAQPYRRCARSSAN